VKAKFLGEGSGHDWWHIERVINTSLAIGQKEKADLFIVELGALLHDIADFKFHGGDEMAGGRAAEKWLKSLGVNSENIKRVRHIVDHTSFKGVGEQNSMKSLEGKVVQDADRLDALGAIGIARAFAYGGYKNREIYNPEKKVEKHRSFEEYKKDTSSTVNHFSEKLLHLKERMNTKTGLVLAKKRHRVLEKYLEQFFAEWRGEK